MKIVIALTSVVIFIWVAKLRYLTVQEAIEKGEKCA